MPIVSTAKGLASLRVVDQRIRVDDCFLVSCPYCGEEVEIYLEPDAGSGLIQDCEVCCNPWMVRVVRHGDERALEVTRADGSE